MQELKPFAFQIINNDTIVVKCKFHLEKNKVRFIAENYNKNHALIIDPILVFSTYSGSLADNFGFTATFDYLDNVYSGGIVSGEGYPVSVGAYQVSHAGTYPNELNQSHWDIGIIKYNSTGTERLFATYIGGIRNEAPHSLVVNSENELYIYGATGSSNFPVTNNSFDITFAGGDNISSASIYHIEGCDMYVAKLSEDGSNLLASTFLGGRPNDGFNTSNSLSQNYGDDARGEIIIDKEDNVYIASYTYSTDFTLNNAHQTSSNGEMEGLVLKLNADLSSLLWGTYLGGGADDAIYSIDVDSNNDIYITGGTNSINFPVSSSTYNNSPNGDIDAFICKFSENGTLLKSTFFGSLVYDQAYFVKLDADDNVYIAGQTNAEDMTLVYNADYFTANSGQFIAKLTPDLNSLIYSTVFGTGIGKPNISLTAFTVDICNRPYLSGWGKDYLYAYNPVPNSGTMGMEVTSDAYQNVTDGQDFYIMILSADASTLEYATFFGELAYDECFFSGRDHVDGGTSRFDKKGNIYQAVCASCGACQEFPTTAGVWSETNNSSNCNNAVFKFNLEPNISIADFISPNSLCASSDIQFENTSLGNNFIWDFGDNSPVSYEENPSHVYNEAGIYDIQLIAFEAGSCNAYDTIVKQIEVLANIETQLEDLDICTGQNVVIGTGINMNEIITDSPISYAWQPASNLVSPNSFQTMAFPEDTTTYILTVQTEECNYIFYQTVNLRNLELNILENNDTTICLGESLLLTANPEEEILQYYWSDTPDFSNILNNSPSENFVTVLSPQNEMIDYFYVKALSEFCIEIDTITVHYSSFKIDISKDTLICKGDTIQLNITDAMNVDISCYWYCQDQTTIINPYVNNPLVFPSENMTYYVEVMNEFSCTAENKVIVQVNNFDFDITNIEEPFCFDDCDGSAVINPIPLNENYSYFSNGEEFVNDTINNLCRGENEITLIDSLSCILTKNISLNSQTDSIGIYIIEIIGTSCYNSISCDGQLSINISGGTSPYTVSITSEDNTDLPNNISIENIENNLFLIDSLCANTYKIHVYDVNNCYRSMIIDIPEPPSYFLNISAINHVKCFGESNGFLSVNGVGGTPPYIYQWNNNENLTDTILENLSAGNYFIEMKDINNCIFNDTIEILQADTLIANIPIHYIPCTDDFIDIEVNVTGGTEPYYFLWNDDNLQNENPALHLPSGTYEVYVNDFNNCKDTAKITLLNPIPLKIKLLDTIHNHCTGICSGEAIVEAIGGTPPYHYVWNTGTESPHATELCPNIHNVTVRDRNLCTASLSVEITEDSNIDLELILLKDISCYGLNDGSVHFQINNGLASYFSLFDNTDIENDFIVLDNLAPDIYDLTIIDKLNCIDQYIFEIKEPEILELETHLLDSIKCNNELSKIEAIVNGGRTPYFYSWINEESNIICTENIANNLEVGNYHLIVKDSSDCFVEENIIVEHFNPIKIELLEIEHNPCFGDSLGSIHIEITGGKPDYQILWSNDSTNLFINNLEYGTYSVEVIDEKNCKEIDSFQVLQPNKLKIYIDSLENIKCFGENTGMIKLKVLGGTYPYQYFWDNDISENNTVNSLFAGDYSVCVVDTNNCYICNTFNLVESNALNLQLDNVEKLDCWYDTTSVGFFVAGGVSPYSFELDNESIESENHFFNGITAGSHDIVMKDSLSCEHTISFYIDAFPMLYASFTEYENNLCHGDCQADLSVEIHGGKPPYIYEWNNGSQSSSIFNLCQGYYWIAIKDDNNCIDTSLVSILTPEQLNINFEQKNVTCFGGNDGEISLNISGGTSPYRYFWSNSVPQQNMNIASSLSANEFYEVNVLDTNNCSDNYTFVLEQPPKIEAENLMVNDKPCFGDSTDVLLNVTGGVAPYEYEWEDSISTNNSAQGLKTGIYRVSIKDKKDCVNYFSFSVKIPQKLRLSPKIRDASCLEICDGIIEMNISGGTEPYNYFINNEQVNEIKDSLCVGEYLLSIKDEHNCLVNDTLLIEENQDTLEFHIYMDRDTIYQEEEIELNAEIEDDFNVFYWYNNLNSEIDTNFNVTIKPTKSTDYYIFLTDTNNCIYYDTLSIHVKELICDEPYIFVPNAFSPNDDGKNDTLFIESEAIEEMYFAIYNRLGNLLFETNDIKKGWDGKFNNEKVETSVLIYYLQATCLNKLRFYKKGNITLIR